MLDDGCKFTEVMTVDEAKKLMANYIAFLQKSARPHSHSISWDEILEATKESTLFEQNLLVLYEVNPDLVRLLVDLLALDCVNPIHVEAQANNSIPWTAPVCSSSRGTSQRPDRQQDSR
jgi:hypothetical protein